MHTESLAKLRRGHGCLEYDTAADPAVPLWSPVEGITTGCPRDTASRLTRGVAGLCVGRVRETKRKY